MAIDAEMSEASVPLPSRTKLSDLQPFTQITVKNLDKLGSILELPAASGMTQYSRESPVVRIS